MPVPSLLKCVVFITIIYEPRTFFQEIFVFLEKKVIDMQIKYTVGGSAPILASSSGFGGLLNKIHCRRECTNFS